MTSDQLPVTSFPSLVFDGSWRGRGTIGRAAIDDCLQKAVLEIIRLRLKRTRRLSVIAELGADLWVKEVGAGHKFSEDTETGRVAPPQFRNKLRRRDTARRGQQLPQTGSQVRTEGQNLIHPGAGHARLTGGRKSLSGGD